VRILDGDKATGAIVRVMVEFQVTGRCPHTPRRQPAARTAAPEPEVLGADPNPQLQAALTLGAGRRGGGAEAAGPGKEAVVDDGERGPQHHINVVRCAGGRIRVPPRRARRPGGDGDEDGCTGGCCRRVGRALALLREWCTTDRAVCTGGIGGEGKLESDQRSILMPAVLTGEDASVLFLLNVDRV